MPAEARLQFLTPAGGRFLVNHRLRSFSGDYGSSHSSLHDSFPATVVARFHVYNSRQLGESNFEFADNYDRFPAPAEARFHIDWRLRSFSGDCRSPISTYLMITIVYQHLRELYLSLLPIATDFNRKIPGPWCKSMTFWGLLLLLTKLQEFSGLLWPVDTLAIILFTAHYFLFSSLAVNHVVVLFYH